MKDKSNFKSNIEELEEINSWFQYGDIDLDEGLVKLKRAKELIKLCKERLNEVENEFVSIKEEIDMEDSGGQQDGFIVERTEVTKTRIQSPATDEDLPF